MTDNEIIKALECCVFTQPCAFDEDKFYCHHGYSKFCDKALLDDALSLINRQKAEIERLKTNLNVELDNFASEYDGKIKAEAYKECIEKVKELIKGWNDLEYYSEMIKAENELDNLLKELVGENDEKTKKND